LARTLDGVTDQVQNTSPTGLSVDHKIVGCWTKTEMISTATGGLYNDDDTGGGTFTFSFGVSISFLFLNVGWTGNGFWRTGNALNDGVWHFVVCDYDRSLAANDPGLYLDGAIQSFNTDINPSGTARNIQDRYTLGNQGTGGQLFDGDIAWMSVWQGTSLTQNQITALTNGVNPFPILNNSDRLLFLPLHGNNSPENEYIQQATGTLTGTTKADTNPPVELLENYL